VTVGALGNLTQFAIIRESYGVVAELSKMKDLGAIATSIAKSGRYLSMTMSVMALFSVALLGGFALVVF
jgi:nitrate reductase NapE component